VTPNSPPPVGTPSPSRGEGLGGGVRTSANRMKAKFALLIKGGTITQERAYELASRAVGRYLTPGFGLSTCDHRELIRVLDAVTGKTSHAEPQRAPRQRVPKDPPNVVRIATVGQLQKAHGLERELKIGMDESAGIARRATGVAHPRTARQVGKYTEALKAIRQRRLSRQSAHRAGSLSGLEAKNAKV